MADSEHTEIVLQGIGGAPGICVGKAYMVDREGVDVVKKYYIPDSQIQNETMRFKSAVKKAQDELHAIIEKIPGDLRENANILETHVVMLKDKMLYGRAIETIEKDGVNAEWALKKVVSRIKGMFSTMNDAYFKDRIQDIMHVSERILMHLVGAEQVNISSIDKRVILVAHDLSPAETSQIQLERIKGFVTDRGGIASHTGIIARTLEIPAVLGLKNATAMIQNDDLLIVDGTLGILIIRPSEESLIAYEDKIERYESHRIRLTRGARLPAKTKDNCVIRVMGNIELPEEVAAVRTYGGDGIGLYRTEFQYLSRRTFPDEFELFDKYRDVVEVMNPGCVTIRTLDINGDKALQFGSPAVEEANPALGLRAIRYCLKKKEVFVTQLRAVLRAAALGNVRVMFPMIADYDEVIQAKQVLADTAQSLEKEGVSFKADPEIGIMIEVPSAVVMADVLAEEVAFFSIGTNDLIQYSMAIDRGNSEVAYLHQPLNPAILRMLDRLSRVSEEQGVRMFMCGEMAANPLYIPVLLGFNINELSMNPQSIPAVKSMIRLIDAGQAKDFVQAALKQKRTADVSAMLEEAFGNIIQEVTCPK